MSFQLLVFDSRRGNKEGEEEDKLLGFYPDATPLDERISLAGLLQGLHTFRQSLQRQVCASASSFCIPHSFHSHVFLIHNNQQTTEKFEIIETDASVWTIHEAEPNIFLALVAIKNWLPRHVSQDTMMACLVHTHHLMNILFAGIQHELDKVRVVLCHFHSLLLHFHPSYYSFSLSGCICHHRKSVCDQRHQQHRQ